MRTAIPVIMTCALLGGCGLMASFRPKPPPPPRPLASNAACAAVAQQRMEDAAANSYEPSMQKAIYDGSYPACVNQQKATLPTRP